MLGKRDNSRADSGTRRVAPQSTVRPGTCEGREERKLAGPQHSSEEVSAGMKGTPEKSVARGGPRRVGTDPGPRGHHC